MCMFGAPALMHSSAEARISSVVIGWLGLARLLKKAPVIVLEIITFGGIFHFGSGSTSTKRLVCGSSTSGMPYGFHWVFSPARLTHFFTWSQLTLSFSLIALFLDESNLFQFKN